MAVASLEQLPVTKHLAQAKAELLLFVLPSRALHLCNVDRRTVLPSKVVVRFANRRERSDSGVSQPSGQRVLAISIGGGEWFPPNEWLEENEALALVSLLRACTTTVDDAWFMLWDGYGDLGPAIEGLPRGTIHRVPEPPNVPAELVGRTWAYRHYLVFRGPLDAVSTWFEWRMKGPNYLWPDDRAWIVATEIDGFSTYVGGPKEFIDPILASPLLEAFPSELTHRFDGLGDPINGAPPNSRSLDRP